MKELEHLTPQERAELDTLLAAPPSKLWYPLPGPQTMAYTSIADVTGYGGAAGGGKTHLACGLAVTGHQRIGIFRQNGTELTAIVDDIEKILGSKEGYNGSDRIWRFKRPDGVLAQIEFGSFPAPGDEAKYRGRPHDLLVFDEAAEMREAAPKFLMGWLRTTDPKQRCRVLLTFNPPTCIEGRWIIDYFAPWLDRKHPNPAKPGELRWFAVVDGKEVEVADSRPFVIVEGERQYAFQAADYKQQDICQPSSRTFIPSRITDNPHLLGTGYMRQLMSMPEPLRSQLLYGDFQAGVEDDPFQVIPTKWVEAAMARWSKPAQLAPMDSIGADIAMKGRDNTVLARRHGLWFDQPVVHRGADCIDGPTIAGFILAVKRDHAVIHIDLFGVGAQPYGHLMAVQQQVVGVNVGEPANGLAADGRLPFKNLRSQLWWRMREALEPSRNTGICLPPSKQLLADLTAPKWKLAGQCIQVQSRDEIIETLGRSPDYGSAYVLALLDTPKRHVARAMGQGKAREYDPYRDL